MKGLKLSLVAAMAAGLCSVASANSLTEALQAGKVSGEITVTYETRDMDKSQTGKYYQDTAYSVGSFALGYKSGVWNNLSLTSKFRAYKELFEDNSDLTTPHGVGAGDASERFWQDGDNKDLDAQELYLTYTPSKDVTVKAGRQFIHSHWVSKTQDAIKLDAAFGNTSLEAIWSLRQGRVYARDYRPMKKMNENKGIYQFALTHKFTENISVTAYDAIVPDVRDIKGGKVNLKYGANKFLVHYAVNSDDKDSTKDSNLLELKASTSIAGFKPYVGYIKVDDKAGFPGWGGVAGEGVDPMEEGDYIFEKDAETFYLGVSKSFGKLSANLLYGTTEYLDGSNKKQDMDETTLWLGYKVNKNLKANLGYTVVNEVATAKHGDYDQLNLTLTYSF